MLKFTYTETGLYLEHLPQALEDWLAQRVVLSLRVGQRLLIEHGTASFLLPVHLSEQASGWRCLQAAAQQEQGAIALSPSDADYMEVSLHGTWMTSTPADAEGVFVASLQPRTELILFKLWQRSHSPMSSLHR